MEAERDRAVSDEELLADLAAKLRDAHRRVAQLDVPDDEKARITRHLLAISDASKRSTTRAAARLDAFLAELPAP